MGWKHVVHTSGESLVRKVIKINARDLCGREQAYTRREPESNEGKSTAVKRRRALLGCRRSRRKKMAQKESATPSQCTSFLI